jgi:hypothetical protein
MTTNSTSSTMSIEMRIQSQRVEEIERTIHHYNDLAVKGLVSMFIPEKRLFCFKLKQTPAGVVQEGVSPRYTVFTLLGLHRLKECGGTSPVDIKLSFEALLADLDWVDNIGDLGLLVWLCAAIAPERLNEIEGRLDVKSALNRFRDAARGQTMELAWFLAGLSHGILARPSEVSHFKDLAVMTYRMLIKNQGEQGIFGHLARHKSVAGMVRGAVGSFADQVYPIYGLTKFAQACNDEHATQRALDCALAICEAQGSLGQWWWHYDSANGRVVDGYPVFSVHQHGMAPMALFALGEAIQSDFSPWIYKGLKWIDNNELGFEMKDERASVVWRCISRPISRKYWNFATRLVKPRKHPKSHDDMKVLFECRPYELGFLLHAFADKDTQLTSIQNGKPSSEVGRNCR